MVGIADDPLKVHSATFAEMRVEVAGMICRLLIDRGARLVLATPAGRISLQVHPGDRLIATLTTTTADPRHLLSLGWSHYSKGVYMAAWDSPMSVSDPSHLAIETFRQWFGVATPVEIDVSAEWVRVTPEVSDS
jgi:hypothetical protein